jgi:hypothetical protein
MIYYLSAGRDVAEVYAASVGAQHFNTSAKLNKEDQNKSKHTKPNSTKTIKV